MIIPSEKKAAIIEALRKHSNARAVAREIGGVSRASVCNIAHDEGIDLTDGNTARYGPKIKRDKWIQIIKVAEVDLIVESLTLTIEDYIFLRRIALEAGIVPPASEATRSVQSAPKTRPSDAAVPQ